MAPQAHASEANAGPALTWVGFWCVGTCGQLPGEETVKLLTHYLKDAIPVPDGFFAPLSFPNKLVRQMLKHAT